VLQPLVENVIFHSRHGQESGVNINLYSDTDEQYLRVTIEDDGVGMDEQTLHHLIRFINSDQPDPSHQSIGLRNVHFRIKRRCGEPYGLTITSELGAGTKVTLLLPKDGRR